MKTEIVGSDIDGVIAHNDYIRADFTPNRLHFFYNRSIPTRYSVIKIDYIISGRKEYFRILTKKWLEKYKINYKKLVLFSNKVKKNNFTIADFKVKKIKEYNITKYYEDNRVQFEILKKYCPNTEIIFIDNSKNNLLKGSK